MKIININSQREITKAQQSFAEEIITFGEDEPIKKDDSISRLMERIPIFLLAEKNMPEDFDENSKKPPTEYLGFYQHSFPILEAEIPIICLCPERIIAQVENDEEFTILIAKVIIHEFAHAKMRMHPKANYQPIDEFYKWMEEPMANLITLQYFKTAEISYRHRRIQPLPSTTYSKPFDYVKNFISMQPANYRLGLDLFEHKLWYWQIWRNRKQDIQQRTVEKQKWLDYVKRKVGNTDKATLESLFEALYT